MEDIRGGGNEGIGIGNGNLLETINAAATAIASAENRVPAAAAQKRRWSSCWGVYWCFGYQRQKHSKRIGHAVVVPQATAANMTELPAAEPALVNPITAPPSSPASFVPSEPSSSSAAQSPAGPGTTVSVSSLITTISASMSSSSSPGGPRSIFAVGPYAHEILLVSPPPAFSSFTTEPSTAPFTPPAESVHLTTTPSSPEVPFAQLLDPHVQSEEDLSPRRFRSSSRYHEFLSYQNFYPGSPVGQLISPGSSTCTSSPFPDSEQLFVGGGIYIPDLQSRVPPRLLPGSGSLTAPPMSHGSLVLDHQNELWTGGDRVSFELTAEDVRCLAKELISSTNALRNSATQEEDDNSSDFVVTKSSASASAGETSSAAAEKGEEDVQQCQKRRSVSLGSTKEFNFDNANEEEYVQKPGVGSNWWANEKDLGNEGESESSKNWSFFPMIIQPDIS
ncbi:hypothetical protein Dimus_008670 [Dionaea muscipula]